MTTSPTVLEAITEAHERNRSVVDRLKQLYGLRNEDLAQALGLNRRGISDRRSGRTKFTSGELAGLAVLFDVPVEVFYMTPGEAVRIAVERDPDLGAPWRAGIPKNACFTAADEALLLDTRVRAAARRRHPTGRIDVLDRARAAA